MTDKKSFLHLETTLNECTFSMIIPFGAGMGNAYDACHVFLQEILKMSQEAVKAAERTPE